MNELNAQKQIDWTVLAWPGVTATTGRRGEWSFRYEGREIGHLHGDRAAHFFFPPELWRELIDAGRVEPHPVFPDREGPAARRINTQADIDDVVAMLRINYDRAVALIAGVRSAA